MIKRIRPFIAVLFAAVFFLLIPTYSMANSAEPPAIVIVVNKAPADLVIEAETGDVRIPATVK